MVKVGDVYTRKHTEYVVKHIDQTNYRYIYVLAEGTEDKIENHLCYGQTIFHQLYTKKEES